MKISTKGRYALRIMMELAANESDKPLSLKDMAARHNYSEKYLEQIISMLNKADFVKSIRGAQGGYLLTREPKEYTIGELLRVTEGSLAPVSCLETEDGECDKASGCVSVILWKKINDAVNEVVDNTTLQDMMDWQSSAI